MTLVLTGLDIEAKAELVRRQLENQPDGQARRDWSGRWPAPTIADADTEEAASALLRCVVRDPDPQHVGRQFSSAAVELALASYPGFTSTSPPGDGQVYGVFTPGYVDAAEVPHVAVHADGTRVRHRAGGPDAGAGTRAAVRAARAAAASARPDAHRSALIAGARSGDKGGSANVGVWVRTDDAVAVAGAHADRRQAARIAARDSRFARHPPCAAATCGR